MGIRSWLFGEDRKGNSKKEKEQQAVATLKKQLNNLEVRGKSLRRQADEQKQMAKQMLKEGNRTGAKQALTRSNIYLQKYNKIQNMSLNLQTQIDTISETKATAETVKALQESTGVVRETFEEISAVDVERTMAEMEDQRDQLDMMNEALADTTSIEMGLDMEFSENIDDQLAAMEMEMQGELPDAGSKTATTESADREAVPAKEEDTSDLEEELEALKKELDASE